MSLKAKTLSVPIRFLKGYLFSALDICKTQNRERWRKREKTPESYDFGVSEAMISFLLPDMYRSALNMLCRQSLGRQISVWISMFLSANCSALFSMLQFCTITNNHRNENQANAQRDAACIIESIPL